MPFGAVLMMIVSLSVILTWVNVESGRAMFLAMWTHGVDGGLSTAQIMQGLAVLTDASADDLRVAVGPVLRSLVADGLVL